MIEQREKSLKESLIPVLPFLRWFPPEREYLGQDIIAGITVALILVPQAMAYAKLAGMPAQYGLYAAFIPGIIGALFGRSSHLATGPSALSAMLTAAVLINAFPDVAVGGSRYIALAMAAALIVGILRLAVRALKLAAIVNFLSESVLCGFTSAAALIIASGQLGKLFALDMPRGENFFSKIYNLATRVNDGHLPTVIMGAVCILILVGCKMYKKRRLPGSLIVAVLATLYVYIMHEATGSAHGIRYLGDIPAGLPPLSNPLAGLDWSTVTTLLPGACVIMFVSFMEAVSVSKAIASKSREPVDVNQEMIGQGLASIAASFTSGYPISGSFSRSALNYTCGGKTPVCQIVTSICVMLTLLFLTPLLYYLPDAALSAIIIMSVVSLFTPKAIIHAWKTTRADGIASVTTFVLTLYFCPDILYGILAGAAVAIIFHLKAAMAPRVCFAEEHADGTWRDAQETGLEVNAEYPLIRFDGRLFFANIGHFEDTVLGACDSYPQAKAILILASGINDLDNSGVYALKRLAENLKQREVGFGFVGVKKQVLEVMERGGVIDVIGEKNLYRTVEEARAV